MTTDGLKRAAGLGGALGSGLGGLAALTTIAPPWAVALALSLLTLIAGLHAVFPQSSADRLRWWTTFWRERRLRARPHPRHPGRAERPPRGPARSPGEN